MAVLPLLQAMQDVNHDSGRLNMLQAMIADH
jgi:hypothetical protein